MIKVSETLSETRFATTDLMTGACTAGAYKKDHGNTFINLHAVLHLSGKLKTRVNAI